ncbi:NAD-glutamate dehydrogenase [Marinobacterium sedimentorum]|uniref:NAD-glutamate dehydrogenase n=1 Tax=Marinobacterium sedimentorum TaxID=2927804 RepID=UPI0020C6B159|nr:NAD-glutamate dehydrogenase [Marinobacterium sedimentorum]MCP8686084.1 NAD-glutamate dehydrogenase [Marinobacterium sedimentorum]
MLMAIPGQNQEPRASQLASLCRLLFEGIDPEALASRDAGAQLASVAELLGFIEYRQSAEARVRVFNPEPVLAGAAPEGTLAQVQSHSIVDVVMEDRPHLVASLGLALQRAGIAVQQVIHPVVGVQRDAQGRLVSLQAPCAAADAEAIVRFEIEHLSEASKRAELEQSLADVIADVRMLASDAAAMRQRLSAAINATSQLLSGLAPGNTQLQETLDYLRWLRDGHFTLVGAASYGLSFTATDRCQLSLDAASRLGILRFERHFPAEKKQIELSAYLSGLMCNSNPLMLTKSTYSAPVIREGHLDYVGVKQYDSDGQVVGEHRFFGLYDARVYGTAADEVPLLRFRLARLRAAIKAPADSFRGRLLERILDQYSRDELLQGTPEDLQEILCGMLEAHDRPRLRLFTRLDAYGRFVSAQVLLPRDKFNAGMRRRLQDILLQALGGLDAEYRVGDLDGLLVAIQYRIHTRDARQLQIDSQALEARLSQALLSWDDQLHAALVEVEGEVRAGTLFERYAARLPAGYRADTAPACALADIQRLAVLEPVPGSSAGTRLACVLSGAEDCAATAWQFKLYGWGPAPVLSDVLPILENLGLRVLEARPCHLTERTDGAGGSSGIAAGDSRMDQPGWILDFGVSLLLPDARGAQLHGSELNGSDVKNSDLKARFQAAFEALWHQQAENDGYNRLVAAAGLDWRQVVVLRAIGAYLGQIKLPFSQSYLQDTLARNSDIAAMLSGLFEARFDPSHDSGSVSQAALQHSCDALQQSLDAVPSLDEDRILRAFLAVIQAITRTNYFQRNSKGLHKDYLSLKLSPGRIPGMPKPCPLFEIFVYSPRVEGVHLRGGKVARGGLRWSDRREDYRTEVLGLLKAQMVKNAVIVPQGSKGGFFCKRLGQDNPAAMQQEAIGCYQTFIRALLDVTDNLVDGEVVAPGALVRHDDDDPYLVVAADKGTATFSDIANAISQEYDFWLGDAFASGGGNGYDHKKMGITARGAWESVKRLFREQGRDSQREDFSVVGIGDMAGDVFGNGMLLSGHIRLVAAFNHRHIFIDPAPDAATSFIERKRLFELQGSSWSDYQAALISPGGGLFERSAKQIRISPEIRQALAIADAPDMLTPAQLIRHILKAPVDLLWNGGIGTYVKASSETDVSVGDRANDAVRINGTDLRCKVVAEGGNLGLTQRGRIEYARAGGLINTDAIDNAGGVDCSDHEVNIKVLLNQAVHDTGLRLEERNHLLAQLDAEVAQAVLDNNYRQAALLSQAVGSSARDLDSYVQLMRTLELDGGLDPALEHLPDASELAQRGLRQEGLSRPELAVLLAYSKLHLSGQLVAAQLADNSWFGAGLAAYFPTRLAQQYPQLIQQHPLRHEILATRYAGELVNRMGVPFATLLQDELRSTPLELLCAYLIARELLGAESLWAGVDALGADVPYALQRDLLDAIREQLEQACRWLLNSEEALTDVQGTLARLQSGIERCSRAVQTPAAKQRLAARADELIAQGIPQALAEGVAQLPAVLAGLDIARMEAGSDLGPEMAGTAYFQLEDLLQLHWLRHSIRCLPAGDSWQRQARASLRTELNALVSELGRKWLAAASATRPGGESIWFKALQASATSVLAMFETLQASPAPSFTQLSVLLQELKRLAQRDLYPAD